MANWGEMQIHKRITDWKNEWKKENLNKIKSKFILITKNLINVLMKERTFKIKITSTSNSNFGI